ncbi:hypothetical protein [Paraburkholderia sediminicola]
MNVASCLISSRLPRSTDHRLESAWFGQGTSIKQKALDQALLMAS